MRKIPKFFHSGKFSSFSSCKSRILECMNRTYFFKSFLVSLNFLSEYRTNCLILTVFDVWVQNSAHNSYSIDSCDLKSISKCETLSSTINSDGLPRITFVIACQNGGLLICDCYGNFVKVDLFESSL